jgi:hypothetical protein
MKQQKQFVSLFIFETYLIYLNSSSDFQIITYSMETNFLNFFFFLSIYVSMMNSDFQHPTYLPKSIMFHQV